MVTAHHPVLSWLSSLPVALPFFLPSASWDYPQANNVHPNICAGVCLMGDPKWGSQIKTPALLLASSMAFSSPGALLATRVTLQEYNLSLPCSEASSSSLMTCWHPCRMPPTLCTISFRPTSPDPSQSFLGHVVFSLERRLLPPWLIGPFLCIIIFKANLKHHLLREAFPDLSPSSLLQHAFYLGLPQGLSWWGESICLCAEIYNVLPQHQAGGPGHSWRL